MRLLFVSMEYPPDTAWGGIATYVHALAHGLSSLGHEVHVLSSVIGQDPRDERDGPVWVHRRRQPRLRGLGLLARGLRCPDTAVRVQTGIANLLHYAKLDERFDLVECPAWGAEGWALAAARRRPLFVQLETTLSLVAATTGRASGLDLKLASWLERFVVRHATHVLTPSAEVADALRTKGWFNGREPSLLPLTIDPSPWRRLTPVERTKPVVLFVGRIERRKALETLVAAVTIVRRTQPDVELVLAGHAGDSAYRAELEALLPDPAVLRFAGYVPAARLRSLMEEARVFVLPSRFESFGLAALEAMAAGRPVIVTSTAGIATFVRQSQAGAIVPVGSPEALGAAMVPFLRDPAEAARAGTAGQALAEGDLSPAVVARSRAELYRRVLEGGVR